MCTSDLDQGSRPLAKILIVEDETVLAETLAENLTDEGHSVSVAGNGQQALETVRDQLPDLIVLDIMLPILDGLSVCRILRKDPITARIPVMILTARGTEVDKIIGLESGADDYLVKPFGLGEFLARVRALLRRVPRQAVHEDQIVAGDLHLNRTSRRVFRGNEELTLTNKEFDVLAEFMCNPGVVLSRDFLLTKVWGYEFFGDRRTVDVHIRWLREKIEDDPSNPRHIITVRGTGYRFES